MSTVIRWNPIRELAAMQTAMDRIFDETCRNFNDTAHSLMLDVRENDGAYTIIANLPGMNPDDININLHDGLLTIVADIPAPAVDEDTRVLVNERVYGKFARRLNLRQPVDADNIDATYENGVLTLVIPKTPEAQPRQIPVRIGNAQ